MCNPKTKISKSVIPKHTPLFAVKNPPYKKFSFVRVLFELSKFLLFFFCSLVLFSCFPLASLVLRSENSVVLFFHFLGVRSEFKRILCCLFSHFILTSNCELLPKIPQQIQIRKCRKTENKQLGVKKISHTRARKHLFTTCSFSVVRPWFEAKFLFVRSLFALCSLSVRTHFCPHQTFGFLCYFHAVFSPSNNRNNSIKNPATISGRDRVFFLKNVFSLFCIFY